MTEGAFTEHLEKRIAEIVSTHESVEGPVLPILHQVQKEFGYIPEAALPQIAQALNITRAELYGVKSFYHDYRDEPPGRHVIRVCRAEACQAMGGRQVAKKLMDALDVGWGETTSDGAVTLEPVYCLGLCSCAPAAQVDGKGVARLNEDMVDTLVAEVRS